MKKILIVGLVLLSIFIIYLANMDKEVYYLALGDSSKVSFDSYGKKVNGYSYYVQKHLKNKGVLEKYVYGYSKRNARIADIINNIKNNAKLDKITLKNALVKADLVTLKINVDDIFLKLNSDSVYYNDIYNYIDELTFDLEKLLKIIREYCKEEIIFIGYYNPFTNKNDSNIQDVIDYINKKYKEVCNQYNVKYLDISDFDENFISNCYSLNIDGDKEIGRRIFILTKKNF